jgi:hypothetical protein
MTLAATRNGFNSYIRHLPQGCIKAFVFAGAVGFGLEAILSNNLYSAKIACAASCTATAIHALITPLFKYVINNHRPLTRGEQLIKTAIAFASSAALFYTLGIPLKTESFLIQCIFQVAADVISPYIPIFNQLQAPNQAKSIVVST